MQDRGRDSEGRFSGLFGAFVGLAVLAWVSAIVAMFATPWFGTHSPDPGAGAGPDVWDLNVETTRLACAIMLALNVGAWVWVTRLARRGAAGVGCAPFVIVGLVSLPAWCVFFLFYWSPA